VLTYDNEGQLTAWQNKPSNPTSTDSFLYDGEGNRVAQQSVSGSVTTQSVYVGGFLEVKSVTGAPSPGNITYYSASGKRIALKNQGNLSYLVGDHLGSTVETLDSAGNVSGSQLYGPYGSARYTNGSMVTDYGFTAQRADSATSLDYYNARYYDPAVGQFGSADSMLDGQNRFGYVGGNPTTYTDPSGQMRDSAIAATGGIGGALVGQLLFGTAIVVAATGVVILTYEMTYPLVSDNWATDTSTNVATTATTTTATATVSSNAVLDHWWTETEAGSTDTTTTGGGGGTTGGGGSGAGAVPGAEVTTAAGSAGPPPDPCGGVSNVDPSDPDAFNITDWSDYPTNGNVPQPKGPFKLLEGEEYDTAREAGNKGAKAYGDKYGVHRPEQSHHIHPIKFGGHPSDPDNLMPLHSPWPHQEYTNWWKQLQKELEDGDYHRTDCIK
jgi:RHS repeat-associated protein